MRADSIGMFWQDVQNKRGKNKIARVMPPIPETGWTAPTYFPNLSAAKAIAVDTETYDPDLKTHGPGWGRGKGHVVGVSLAVEGGQWYFPIRHEVQPETNMDPDKVLAYIGEALSTRCPKIGANLIYDVGWLRQEGVEVSGPLYDIQFAEALLNSEAPSVALEELAQKYLGTGKETSLLYQWCADYYGGNPTQAQRSNIYRAPPSLVGYYAEGDAALPLQVMAKQWPLLHKRGVLPLFEMECKLIRLLLEMRWKGAPVDLEAAHSQHDRLGARVEEIKKQIKDVVGFEVNPGSNASMQKAFDHLSLPYHRTAAGNPSFPAALLENTNHKLCELILDQRRCEKIMGTFLKGYIIDKSINGRVHCQFHPLRGDTNGARSGRFSSSEPNLQNIPVRTEEGKLIRSAFVATGRCWRKYDYSQIEYRLLAHHAEGPGAEEIRQRYRENPKTDYHDETIQLIRDLTGIELKRRNAKTINFGLIYGMGKQELINRLGLGRQQGNDLFNNYHKAVPFAKVTADNASQVARQTGEIRTLLGRVSDFDRWGPSAWDPTAKAVSFDIALRTYGSIERAFTHKALNRRLQGGAADIMKAAMVRCYEDGVFDMTGIPLLTVHDELDFDDEGAPQEAWDALTYTMENCVEGLKVPILVDGGSGANWGEAD